MISQASWRAISMKDSVKLNFVIPKECDEALTEYCDQTGRVVSDLLRQLIHEYVDGDRTLESTPIETLEGVRSNMIIPARVLEAFDTKIAANRKGSRGAVIAQLLNNFLEPRRQIVLTEKLEVTLERDLIRKLQTTAKTTGRTIDEIVSDACKKDIKRK